MKSGAGPDLCIARGRAFQIAKRERSVMFKKNLKIALVAATLAAASSMAPAQSIRPTYQFPPLPDTGTQIANTPIFITPYMGFGAGHDDNVLMTPSGQVSSNFYVFSPGFRLDARDANKVVQLSYQGQIGRYSDSEDDNYIDHTVRAQFDTAFDRRNFLKLGFDYVYAHEPRNSTDRGISLTPDKYRYTSPSALYAFGAPGAAGRVELYYSANTYRYLNNREITAAFDRKGQELGGAFYARVAPKTYFVAEARRTDFSYREPDSLLNSEERRYFGGVMWEATAATTGTLKVGRMEKRFDSDLPEFTGTAWEAIISWAPRTYSRFDLFTSRTTTESSGLGTFIVSEVTGAVWTHTWTSVLSTAVDFRYRKDDYQGFDRTDDTKAIGLKVGYKFRRWLTLGAEYTHTQRDSDRPLFNYDRNFYLLTATASM